MPCRAVGWAPWVEGSPVRCRHGPAAVRSVRSPRHRRCPPLAVRLGRREGTRPGIAREARFESEDLALAQVPLAEKEAGPDGSPLDVRPRRARSARAGLRLQREAAGRAAGRRPRRDALGDARLRRAQPGRRRAWRPARTCSPRCAPRPTSRPPTAGASCRPSTACRATRRRSATGSSTSTASSPRSAATRSRSPTATSSGGTTCAGATRSRPRSSARSPRRSRAPTA